MTFRLPTVYPRVCGGSGPFQSVRDGALGLSPRVRGKPYQRSFRNRHSRSIPACAGEAGTATQEASQWTVYPRVCGGSRAVPSRYASGAGLSPRVRGKPIQNIDLVQTAGSIPACAGEAPVSVAPVSPVPVYPRVCGGSVSATAVLRSALGLSPRVRGKLGYQVHSITYWGSIPACAGEAQPGRGRLPSARVYPRVCGGSPLPCVCLLASRGLSPRVRGKRQSCRGRAYPAAPGASPRRKRQSCRGRVFVRRSIPACAGEAKLLA